MRPSSTACQYRAGWPTPARVSTAFLAPDDAPAARRARERARSAAEDFVQPLEDLLELVRSGPRDALSESLRRECPDLADLDPGLLRELRVRQGKGKGKSGSRRLTRERDGDDGP